ncbi:septin-7 [Tribolium castaneum]|uniref:Protein peanut-like Protein n=1 Tax=Tribolium castaneum TaxID=7070 RepID=D6WFQ2_TRICA|nr:PREDICTED: septin-7 [Tribolium castaneum]EFA00509.1 Protein peanut-like Protein [Tribolium castaneum]|eukprot:XP_966496.1 PREDICTED: septin-7 [Tribolium castaneum]
MSANNVNAQPAPTTQATATIKSRPNIMPSSYLYTSSSALLNRNAENKPTPPPTLPKYTSSFNAGSGLNRDRDKDSIGGSYRLSSLDRLAMRQKFMDQQSPTNGTITTQTNGSEATSIQTKREMFFTSTTDTKDSNRVKPPEPPAKTPPEQPAKEDSKESTPEIVKERPKLKELDGYVGFANLPNQVYRKAVKKGFEFTLMVVGESGLGKSTLINSMFLTEIYNATDYPGPTQRLKKTVAVETTRVMLKENGVNLLLTMVDTPGFGDAVDNSNCWAPIIEYIESKYEDYLNSEARVTRKQIPDQRVHCCLYFIQPSGHGLKSLDIEFMKRLCDKVNIIPIIAKADTLTSDECALFKKQILNEIAQNKIKIYEFPDTSEDDEEHKLNKSLKERVPFAVVGSNTVIEVDGKKVRGRKYPWGIAEVENLEHCDFIALRNMIIRTHLQDLKDVTNNVHYENYRCRKLAGLGVDGKPSRISNKNPLAQMDEEKREHDLKMKKMEAEMEQVFEMKVREKKQKLKDSEAELTRRHEATKKQLEQQAKELEEKRRQFEMEKEQWEKENQITVEELRRRSLEGSREAVDGKKEKKKKGLF